MMLCADVKLHELLLVLLRVIEVVTALEAARVLRERASSTHVELAEARVKRLEQLLQEHHDVLAQTGWSVRVVDSQQLFDSAANGLLLVLFV